VARSFAGIFYRNAINLGLPVIVAEGDLGVVEDGVQAELDLDAGQLRLAGAAPVALEPLPDNLKTLLADGGLVPHLKKRFAAGRNRD
jgi:3-isopropylmalate/(R)-2-methylmalate dehydratase small subunit